MNEKLAILFLVHIFFFFFIDIADILGRRQKSFTHLDLFSLFFIWIYCGLAFYKNCRAGQRNNDVIKEKQREKAKKGI